MIRYRCQVRKSDGTLTTVEITATSFSAAFDQLSEQGLTIEGIQVADLPSTRPTDKGEADPPPIDHESPYSESRSPEGLPFQLDLGESISTLTPILNAARQEITDQSLDREFETLLRRLSGESQLTQLLQDRQLLRDPRTCQAIPLLLRIRSGQANAQTILDWLNAWIREQGSGQDKRFPYFYPLIILSLAGLILIYCATTLIPIFDEMFEEFQLQLPPATAFVLEVGRQITHHGPRTAAITLVVIGGMTGLLRFIGPHFSSIPLIGRWVVGGHQQLLALSNFTAILAELIPITPDLPTAIRVANQGCHEKSLSRSIREFVDRLENVPHANLAPNPGPGVPATVVHALTCVSNPKSQTAVLRCISEIYQHRRLQRLNFLGMIFPSLAMLIVGMITGMLAIVLFAPLVSLASSLNSIGW